MRGFTSIAKHLLASLAAAALISGMALAEPYPTAPPPSMPLAPPAAVSSPDAVNPPAASRNQIRLAQRQLQVRGFYHAPIDGMLDAPTKDALSRYQKQNGLSETATPDKATMQSLLEPTGVGGYSKPPTSSHATPRTNPNSAGAGPSESATSPY